MATANITARIPPEQIEQAVKRAVNAALGADFWPGIAEEFTTHIEDYAEGGRRVLLDAGWTLIPPTTDDLPDGWDWEHDQYALCPAFTIRHNRRTVASVELAGVPTSDRKGQVALFASEIVDRLTRVLADLGDT